MSRKPKFDDAQKKEIVDLFNSKKKVKEIAKDKGTTPATIVSVLDKAGVYKWRKNKKGAGKKGKAGDKARSSSLETIMIKLNEAKAEVERLEQLLKKTVKREQFSLNKIKHNLGMK